MFGRTHQPQELQAWEWWCESRPAGETGLSAQMNTDKAPVGQQVLSPPQERDVARLRAGQHSPRDDSRRPRQRIAPVSQTVRGVAVPTGRVSLFPMNPHAYVLY